MPTDRDGRRTILFVHSGGGVGGAPVSMLQLAASLPKDRYRSLAVFTEPGQILEFARAAGVPARVVPLRSAFFYSAHVPIRLRMLASFVVYFWPSVRACRALLEEVKPDLVHLNTSVLIPCALAARQHGAPVVWHVREVPGPRRWLRRWHVAMIRRLADRIIANSHFVARAFGEGEGGEDGGVEVIHNAVDLTAFAIDAGAARRRVRAELGVREEAPVVGMLGTVQAVKGHALLLQAAPTVAAALPNVRFLLVTGGAPAGYARSMRGRLKRVLGLPLDNLERLQRAINDAGLNQYFLFTGFRTDVAQMIAAMDVLAFLPQAPEGFGRPLIEAMAMRRPVVATDIGPTREIAGDEAATLVPPGDPTALSDALIHLLRRPDLCRRLGEAGYRRVAECHEIATMQRKIATVYDEVLRAADPRRDAPRRLPVGTP